MFRIFGPVRGRIPNTSRANVTLRHFPDASYFDENGTILRLISGYVIDVSIDRVMQLSSSHRQKRSSIQRILDWL